MTTQVTSAMTPAERLAAQTTVRTPDECWPFTGQRNAAGYGRLRLNGKRIGAHRVAYMLHVGPIPDGQTVDHLCRNRACVNVRHLELVSHTENVRRGNSMSAVSARTGMCGKGLHLLPPKQPGERQRWCRPCAQTRDAGRRR